MKTRHYTVIMQWHPQKMPGAGSEALKPCIRKNIEICLLTNNLQLSYLIRQTDCLMILDRIFVVLFKCIIRK